MIQYSMLKSMQNDAQKRSFKQKKHRCWVFLRHCLAWFRTLGYFYWPAAEPLADARGTKGFRGTPVEKHWLRPSKSTFNAENFICSFPMTVPIDFGAMRSWNVYSSPKSPKNP